jgi:hypothetical protein
MLKLEDIDFHDSTIERINISNGSAVMTIRDWQERLVTIRLNRLVFFRCYELPSLVEASVVHDSAEIRDAIDAIRADGGSPEGYNNFHFTQLNLENVVAVFVSYEAQRNGQIGAMPGAE